MFNNKIQIINSDLQTMDFGIKLPYKVIDLDGVGNMSNYLSIKESPYLDGTQVFGHKREAQEIHLQMWVSGTDREDFLLKRKEFQDFFSPKKTSIMIWEDEFCLDLEHKGYQELKGPNFEFYTDQAWSVTLYAPYPYWYGKVSNMKMFNLETGGFELPFSYPFSLETTKIVTAVLNEGNMVTPVTWKIRGPLVYPSMYNISTGKKLEFDVELFEGDILDIETDTKNRHATITRANGDIENAISFRTGGSEMWWMEKGTNDLAVSVFDSGLSAYIKMWHKNWVVGV